MKTLKTAIHGLIYVLVAGSLIVWLGVVSAIVRALFVFGWRIVR